jgi:hypothetical protein
MCRGHDGGASAQVDGCRALFMRCVRTDRLESQPHQPKFQTLDRQLRLTSHCSVSRSTRGSMDVPRGQQDPQPRDSCGLGAPFGP